LVAAAVAESPEAEAMGEEGAPAQPNQEGRGGCGRGAPAGRGARGLRAARGKVGGARHEAGAGESGSRGEDEGLG
jgi:hypothetical protein